MIGSLPPHIPILNPFHRFVPPFIIRILEPLFWRTRVLRTSGNQTCMKPLMPILATVKPALDITAGVYHRWFCDILRILALSPIFVVSNSAENASPRGESALPEEDVRLRGACKAESEISAPVPATRRSSISAKAASTRPNASFTVLGHAANISATRRRATSTNL